MCSEPSATHAVGVAAQTLGGGEESVPSTGNAATATDVPIGSYAEGSTIQYGVQRGSCSHTGCAHVVANRYGTQNGGGLMVPLARKEGRGIKAQYSRRGQQQCWPA
jgi:hypothetical protein